MIRARAVTPLRSNSIRRQRARRRIARDVFGKPLSITRSGAWNGSPISESRRYVYDTHQRLCKRVEPETGASFASYDAAGNIAWTASGSALTAIDTASQCEADRSSVPTASQTVRTYDARNRVLGVAYPNGADGLAYRYFNDGALRTLSNGAGASLNTWTYTYDLRRLPTTETLAIDGRSSTITHAYDAYGHASQLTWPDGLTVPSTPNALGQPTQAGAYASAIAYFPNGGMSGFTYGNGIVHTLTQNTRELPLRSLDQKPGQSAILDDTYSYDANANVAAIADGTAGNAASRTMAYDGLDRLTTTHAPHQWWISAATSFDALDNIRTNQVGNTAAYINTFSYDPTTWRLTAISGHVNWALSYDQNGNVTSKGAGNDAYGFDAANRLTAVTGKESYRYDGYGRRVKITRSTDGKIDYPVYDLGGHLLTEDDQRSNTTTDYVSLNGSLVAKRASPIGQNQWTTSYEHTDALRSPREETSATGALTRAELYTPYGEPGDGKYVQGPGYTGHVTDAATHLTYAQQRYYDPVMGRFLSTDPVQASDTGASFNRYWYANNNPYKFTDKDGRNACLGQLVCGVDPVGQGNQPDWRQQYIVDTKSGKKSWFSMIGPRLSKALKLDVGVGPGLSVGVKLTNNLKVQAGGHAVAGVSIGGKSGLEGFAEREASVGAKVGPAEASLGIDKVRAGADPQVLRESTNKFGIESGRVSAGAETDRTISVEATVFAVHVKLAVDPGGVLFAFFGPSNGYVQDGIK